MMGLGKPVTGPFKSLQFLGINSLDFREISHGKSRDPVAHGSHVMRPMTFVFPFLIWERSEFATRWIPKMFSRDVCWKFAEKYIEIHTLRLILIYVHVYSIYYYSYIYIYMNMYI